MQIVACFIPVIQYLLRGVILKFIVFTVMFAVMALLYPFISGLIAPFISGSSLSSGFGNVTAGVWYFLDYFDLGVGIPMLLSAYITRFMIRRLPVVG